MSDGPDYALVKRHAHDVFTQITAFASIVPDVPHDFAAYRRKPSLGGAVEAMAMSAVAKVLRAQLPAYLLEETP